MAKAKEKQIGEMNLSELNEIGAQIRARYDELRAEALHEIKLTMSQYGISEKMVAEALVKRRAKRTNGASDAS